MNMTWNEVLMYIIEYAFKLVIAVAIPYVFNLIRVKVNNDIVVRYMYELEKIIQDAVKDVQQTYVNNLKAEDLFDIDAQATAFKMVKENVTKSVSDNMRDVIMKVVGDFDTYLNSKIEANVYDMKFIEN